MMPAGSLLKHADVRVLWHIYCGSRDRVDTDTFLDAVRHHLAADPTVDPAAALDLLSGDNRTALASALDADSSGQVRARTKLSVKRSRSHSQELGTRPGQTHVQMDRSVTVTGAVTCTTWLLCRCPSRKLMACWERLGCRSWTCCGRQLPQDRTLRRPGFVGTLCHSSCAGFGRRWVRARVCCIEDSRGLVTRPLVTCKSCGLCPCNVHAVL